MTLETSHHRRGLRRLAVAATLPSVLALLGASALAPVDAAPAPSTPAASPVQRSSAAAAATPADVTLLRTRTSLLGVHRWYRQTVDGVPVVGGLYAEHTTTKGAKAGTVSVWDGRVAAGPLASASPSLAPVDSVAAAEGATGGEQAEGVEPSLWVVPGLVSRLAYRVTTVVSGATNGNGIATSDVTYVDAQSGEVLRTEVESKSDDGDDALGALVTGSARTFDPSPPVKLQRQDLRDQNDAAAAVPNTAYTTRPLTNLAASHTLIGRWARIDNANRVSSPTDTYNFTRTAEGFEQVMAYYALNVQQEYYRSLGFTDVNAEQQNILTNTITDDNSFYSPSADQITMGSGGVDDAEDPEVTWHENGHATQDDQVPDFGQSAQAGAIGEAFGDYIAVTMADVDGAADTATTPSWCVMDWDSVSYSSGPIHCLRTTQEDKTYPGDLDGEVHDDGEIWSQALYEMNLAIGRDNAARAIIEAQFTFTPTITMPNAARKTVAAARTLYGNASAAKVRKCFADRGIL